MASICNGTCIIFDEETKISTGKQQKQGGRLELGGETHFLAGHPFTLTELRFSGFVTGGCLNASIISELRFLLKIHVCFVGSMYLLSATNDVQLVYKLC